MFWTNALDHALPDADGEDYRIIRGMLEAALEGPLMGVVITLTGGARCTSTTICPLRRWPTRSTSHAPRIG